MIANITTAQCETTANRRGQAERAWRADALLYCVRIHTLVFSAPPPLPRRMDSLRKGVHVVQKKIRNSNLISIDAAAKVCTLSSPVHHLHFFCRCITRVQAFIYLSM